jgi:Cu+-exporting ATPase
LIGAGNQSVPFEWKQEFRGISDTPLGVNVRSVFTLSRATMRNIRENLIFAFAYNAIGIPIAAGVLYPAFGILLSPIVGALAMSLSSVSVILNALRLRTLKL